MRMTVKVAILALCASGCAPLSIYYKPGASVTRLDRDTTACQVDALKDAPVANQIRREPPVLIPGRVVCNSAGHCYDTGPYWIQGRVYTVDVNADLREKLTDQCMGDKGYAPVRIPQCPLGVADKAPPKATTRLPDLTPKSCAVLYKSGAYQILEVD